MGSKVFLSLRICPDGSLEFSSSGSEDSAIFTKVKIRKLRWTHIALVYYSNRSSNPSVRQSNTIILNFLLLTTPSGLFVDGALSDTLNWSYPKPEPTLQTGAFVIGDASKGAKMSWCIASAYLIASSLGMSLSPLKSYTQTNLITDDDVLRLIHQLGPRYTGNFQDPALVKFLSYKASTSLNMTLMTIASKQPNSIPLSLLMKIVREGLRVPEASIYFAISPVNARDSGPIASISTHGLRHEFVVQGDVFAVKAEPLHMTMWKIGGAAVALKLVQAAGASVIA